STRITPTPTQHCGHPLLVMLIRHVNAAIKAPHITRVAHIAGLILGKLACMAMRACARQNPNALGESEHAACSMVQRLHMGDRLPPGHLHRLVLTPGRAYLD